MPSVSLCTPKRFMSGFPLSMASPLMIIWLIRLLSPILSFLKINTHFRLLGTPPLCGSIDCSFVYYPLLGIKEREREEHFYSRLNFQGGTIVENHNKSQSHRDMKNRYSY